MHSWDIWTYLRSNPFLVAGLGTVLTGGMIWTFKAAILKSPSFISKYFVSTIKLHATYGDDVARVCDLLDKYRLNFTGQRFSVNKHGYLSAGYGIGVAMWEGLLIGYNRYVETANTFGIIDHLELHFFTHDRTRIQKFLNIALTLDRGERDTISLFSYTEVGWKEISRAKRSLDTIFVNGDLLTDLQARIQWFIDNEAWYIKRGITYKMVICLHGVPGTGKTSLIHGLASFFNKDIYAIDSVYDLSRRAYNIRPGQFLAIEDIDLQAKLTRGDETQMIATQLYGGETVPALHGVLNTLDGFQTPHGLIAFISTNNLDGLDPALVRPGRVDLLLEVKPLDYHAAVNMYAAFYGQFEKPAFAKMLHRLGYQDNITGATFQQIYLQNPDAQNAFSAVFKLVAKDRVIYPEDELAIYPPENIVEDMAHVGK